jgi:TonB family protein
MPPALLDQSVSASPVPALLVELPSRRWVFFGNLRDLISPERQPQLELTSAPAPFWDDVFVERRLPWSSFLKSGVCHVAAFVSLIAITRFFAMQPHAVLHSAFDRTQVVSYQSSEYLPPLDTRRTQTDHPAQADPEYSRQSVISVPREADNRSQTIVAAPQVKLKNDVALPNIIAWSDTAQKPKLYIPAAPLTLAADLTRIAPQMEDSVVTPPPDAAHLTRRLTQLRDQPSLQSAVVAPPPTVETASARTVGDLNIGRSSVIAPAPQLSVAEQRTLPQGRARGLAAQVVPPPPSVAASGSSGQSFGARGRVVALNLHPAVGAPPDLPSGYRRGAFAATPEGHPGGSGTPGSSSAVANGQGNDSGSKRKGTSDLPAGLYVGNAAGKTSPAGGEASTKNADSANPNLIANARLQAGTSSPAQAAQTSSAKLSPVERQIFGGRKFYSLTLNMPNLNSAGGSWIIHFAELKQDPKATDEDLSHPTATRKVDPAYPTQVMKENVAGTVILYALIRADGSVGSVRVLRGVDGRLDRYASQAVSQWQFQPATRNGVPVDVEATFQIPFHPSLSKSDF